MTNERLLDLIDSLDRIFVLSAQGALDQATAHAAHAAVWDFLGKTPEQRLVRGSESVEQTLAGLARSSHDLDGQTDLRGTPNETHL